MPVPGDVVDVRMLEDGRVLIDRVHDRGFTLLRRSIEGRSKIMAANVDMLATVTSLAEPPPRLLTLDQLLAFAEFESLRALVVFTKPDLADEATAGRLRGLYAGLGYDVVVVNPKAGVNVEELRSALAGRCSMLSGVSGVGKSSIFRALGGEAVVGETARHGLGRQTTTAARLYRLPEGFLIDSPGVAEFGLGAVVPQELVQGFREMRDAAPHCRFTDCTHREEPGCAVKAGIEQGTIAESRYLNYRRILDPRYQPPQPTNV